MKINRKVTAALGGLAVAGVLFLAGSANAAPVPSNGGAQASGAYLNCVRNQSTDLHYIQVPNNGVTTCPAGYSNQLVAGEAQFQALKTQVANIPPAQKGDKGDPGVAGPAGAAGATGPAGAAGAPGADAAIPQYGIALVNVARGGNAATTWASYSTALGSPVGDTTSGEFRMTCNTANAPCEISVQAYSYHATSTVSLYPRLLISKDDFNTGAAVGNCEYGDGVNNDGGSISLSNDAANKKTVPLGIGGTLDCGSAQVHPADGTVTSILVPAGFYDIAFTGVFKQ